MTRVFNVSQLPDLKVDKAGVYRYVESGDVRWSALLQAFQITDRRTGLVLFEAPSPRGQKGERKALRAKVQRLAEHVQDLRAGGARRHRALRRCGL